MRQFVADLHVHSVLSPCAEVEMTPRNIVWHADKHGIDIVAITDHNACDNVIAAFAAAKGTNVIILPGMEVETKEEVHLIVLFEKIRQLKVWDQFVKQHMSGQLNDEKRFGAQFVVDEADELIRIKPEMLLNSLSSGITEICKIVMSSAVYVLLAMWIDLQIAYLHSWVLSHLMWNSRQLRFRG